MTHIFLNKVNGLFKMTNELNQKLKESIGEFSRKTHKIIKKKYPKRSSVIIQFNNGNVFVGGIKGGSFKVINFGENSKTQKVPTVALNISKY